MSRRSFRIVELPYDNSVEFTNGVYYGRGPGQAALKAFNWYCRKKDLKNCTGKFTIEEMTRGKQSKRFHYIGTRRKLQVPKQIKRGTSSYTIDYETTVRKAK